MTSTVGSPLMSFYLQLQNAYAPMLLGGKSSLDPKMQQALVFLIFYFMRPWTQVQVIAPHLILISLFFLFCTDWSASRSQEIGYQAWLGGNEEWCSRWKGYQWNPGHYDTSTDNYSLLCYHFTYCSLFLVCSLIMTSTSSGKTVALILGTAPRRLLSFLNHI